MEENMKDHGKWESNMEREFFIIPILKFGKKVYGTMEKELDGFKENKSFFFY